MDKKQRQTFLILLALSSILLYVNTLQNKFALDDTIVILENDFTKKGFAGIPDQLSNDQFTGFYGEKKELVAGGRYRPLSMVVFNIQYALWGENPKLSHLFNLLLYLLNGIALFLVLEKLLLKKTGEKLLNIATICTLIWFYHPIHTEAVANIKGLDEILSFSLVLFSLYYIIKTKSNLIIAALFFFLALLAKENAITWLAIVPLCLYFFKDYTVKDLIKPTAVLFSVTAFWLLIRYKIVGISLDGVADNLMNDPFLDSSIWEKYATIVYTLGKYVQLLIFPHPLTFDYYPKHIPILNWTSPKVIFSLTLYISLIVLALKQFAQKSILSFSILFFGITLSIVSNLIFPIGAFMNERFVYVSSLGFCLIVAYFLLKLNKKFLIPSLVVLLALYSVKTISRNTDWKDNFALSTHDANISVNGAKSNVMAGGSLVEAAQKEVNLVAKMNLLNKGIQHLNQAINVYPEYIDALILMGNAQWEKTKDAKYVIPYYQRILRINPYHQNTWNNVFIVLEQNKDVDFKINTYKLLIQIGPSEIRNYLNIGRAYGREKNNLTEAIKWFEKGKSLSPNDFDILTNLGTVYGLSSQFNKAVVVLEQAKKIRPRVAKTYIDLGLSYYSLGKNTEAKLNFDEASKLDKSIERDRFPI